MCTHYSSTTISTTLAFHEGKVCAKSVPIPHFYELTKKKK